MISPDKPQNGFTLVEIMIVVMIIGILAAIAVPNFIAYRSKASISTGIATGETIRTALAAYAASSHNNTYPPAINSWDELRQIANENGGTLKTASQQHCVTFQNYTTINATDFGEAGDYYLLLYVTGVPGSMSGSTIEIRPSGINRQTH